MANGQCIESLRWNIARHSLQGGRLQKYLYKTNSNETPFIELTAKVLTGKWRTYGSSRMTSVLSSLQNATVHAFGDEDDSGNEKAQDGD